MSRADFCRMTVKQYGKVVEAHSKRVEFAEREAWERMRILAAVVVQPHLKNKITPERLLPMPWDLKPEAPKPEAPKISREEAQRRFAELIKNENRGKKKQDHN